VHRRSISIIVQRDATQRSLFIILQVNSTCFGCQPHPSSVHKTVTTASGTSHTFCAATSLQRGQGSLATLDWPRVYVYESTEDVFTVLVWQMELIARRSVMSILAYVGIWSDRDKEGRRWKEFIVNFQPSFSATNYRFSKCTKYCFMMALPLVSELV
jgi:hypothetical protein